MPRRPRLHVPGALYHVILRGNGRRAIFLDPDDRVAWEELLSDRLQRFGHRIHAYCWMTNHVHMAIQAADQPLAAFVNSVASSYARWMHRRLEQTGHFFERRYRAIMVDTDAYALELVRYIHQNPVRARLVAQSDDYPWSSHTAYLTGDGPGWLTQNWMLSLLAATEYDARRQFAAFMSTTSSDVMVAQLRAGRDDDGRMLGDDSFLKSIAESKAAALMRRVTLEEIVAEVCTLTGVCADALVGPRRQHALVSVRAVIAAVAAHSRAVPVAAVARRFGRSEASISRRVHRLTGEEMELVERVCRKLRS